MDLKKKTVYVPGIVPGETSDEVIKNLLKGVGEIVTPRDRHILCYCKRARIRKKYIDRLTRDAFIVFLIREIFDVDNVSARELLHKFKRGDLCEFGIRNSEFGE